MADSPKIDIDKLLDVADPSQVVQTGILADIRKGIADGFGELSKLLKGKMAEPEPEPDGDEDDDGGDDAPEGKPDGDGADGDAEPEKKPDHDDPEDDKGPGYEDMRLSADGALQIDATEYLLGLEAKVDAQARDTKALRKAVRESRDENRALRAELREYITALGGVLAPMAKAIQNTQTAMLDIPAAVHDTGRAGRQAVAKQALDAARKIAPGIDVVVLAKGLRAGIITEQQKQRWHRDGVFSTDDATHAEIVDRLQKQ